MTREELAQQLKDVAEMLEKGNEATSFEQIADAINKKNPIEAVNACEDLINVLINKHMNVNNAFFIALAENSVYEEGSEQFEEAAKEWAEQHDYFKQGSEEFEDAAHEWADDNGLYDIKDFAFEDLADKFDNGEVRDFVVDYITQNL